MTYYCRLCGLPLTPIREEHGNVTYAWWYCAEHENADQEHRSVPVKIEGH